jgi:cellulose synthase/poly-beta-1,6-N-acetylglucosamine synthase-like glycosyltransferase
VAFALDIALNLLAAAFALPLVVFALECFAALLPSRKPTKRSGERGRAAVLIPAHNEALGIARTIESLRGEAKPGDRTVVIADNCTDDTAAVARAAGAEVTERFDAVRRGKGFALDHGVRYLEANPPDVVIVVDADCRVSPGFFDEMTTSAMEHASPIQCVNLTIGEKADRKNAVAVLANRTINLVRPTGLSRLGGPCRLLGTGMGFPWPLIQSASLATGSLVEDMKLGIDLAIEGHDTRFESAAMVTSALPPGHAAFATQRARWESGHLQTFVMEAPRLLAASFLRRSLMPIWLALHLCVPALSLLFGLWVIALAGALLARYFGACYVPPYTLGISGALALLGLFATWAACSREQVPLSALVRTPFYLASKVLLYVRMLASPRTQWVRTRREAETHS